MPGSPIAVSDFLSNFNDQLATAARILGRSKHRQAIFRTVYRGQKQVKTIEEICRATGLSQVHVLNEGGKMANLLIEKVAGGYKKKKEFATRYHKILALAKDRKKLERLPTKTSPRSKPKTPNVTAVFPSSARGAKFVTIDEIGSFSKVGDSVVENVNLLREDAVKRGFAKILGEQGSFKDWGGEKSDLFTTRVNIRGRRVSAAIAFKGRATKGKLVPGKMGVNGDQINRLFDEPAQLFLVVYGGQVDSSIISKMQAFAMGKAMSGRKILYGTIDGRDLGRLCAAYPECFSLTGDQDD